MLEHTLLVICTLSNSCLLIFSSFDSTIVMSVSMTDDEQPYDYKDYGNEPIIPGTLLCLILILQCQHIQLVQCLELVVIKPLFK